MHVNNTEGHKYCVITRLSTTNTCLSLRKITVNLVYVTCVRGHLNNHAHFIMMCHPSAVEEGQNRGEGYLISGVKLQQKEGRELAKVTFRIKPKR